MKSNSKQIFSSRMVMVLAGIGVISMFGLLLISSFGDSRGTLTTVNNNSYSYSAIGHKALIDSMRNSDIPVVVSQYRTDDRMMGFNSVLMLLEPRLNDDEELKRLLEQNYIIYALPKRVAGGRDRENFRWIREANLIRPTVSLEALQLIDKDASVVRLNEDDDYNWTENHVGFTPEIKDIQLIASEKITPLLATDKGILIGSLRKENGGTVIVISDPDIFANFGLGKGDNAEIAYYVINLFLSQGTTFFVDETIHGFERNPDIYRAAFEFPFSLFSIQLVIFVILLIWASLRRFGSPVPVRPDYKSGKLVLVENGINLLSHGNHKPEILNKYVHLTQIAMARKLHAPKNLTDDEMVEWLDDYGKKHGVSVAFRTIKQRANLSSVTGKSNRNSFMDRVHEKPLLQIVRYLEQWKQEMLNGSGSNKIN